MKIMELTNEQFYTFYTKFKTKSVYQTNPYAFVMNEQGFNSHFIGLYDNLNELVAASLILVEQVKNYRYAYAPRGFLIDYNNASLLMDFTELLKKFLKEKDILAIKIAPPIIRSTYDAKTKKTTMNESYETIFTNLTTLGYFHLGYNNYFEALKPRFDATIDLTQPLYNLFNNFNKEYRTKVRSAINKGVLIYRGDKNDIDHLYKHTERKYPRDIKYFNDAFYFFGKNNSIELYYAKLDYNKYLTVTKQEHYDKEQELNELNDLILKETNKKPQNLIKRKIALDVVYERTKRNLIQASTLFQNNDDLILASMLVVKNGDEVFMFMDGMNPRYKKFNAKHLLMWSLIEKYKKEGFVKFNIGGCSNPTIRDNKYQGLVDFKTSFGAIINEYAGDFELIVNKPKYLMYKNSMTIQNIMKK